MHIATLRSSIKSLASPRLTLSSHVAVLQKIASASMTYLALSINAAEKVDVIHKYIDSISRSVTGFFSRLKFICLLCLGSGLEEVDCTNHNCMNGGTPVVKDGCCACECCEGYSGDQCEIREC